jgi:hypothetical protein
MPKAVRISITNIYMDGDYTGTVNVGRNKKPANVILDTGSSTLAINGDSYDPTKDPDAQITKIAQEVSYGDGSNWNGGVVLTDIGLGSGQQAVTLPKVNVAVAFNASANMFRKTDGILGLAYTRLNNAFVMPGNTIPPVYTFNQIQNGTVTYLVPYFTQLEDAGIVANKFAFYTLRSLINLAKADPGQDPLNAGFLIFGGGEESTDLYTGPFQNARVVDDEFYNTNLKAIIVGDRPAIEVSAPTRASGLVSNTIVDSGTNSLTLDQTLFNKVLAQFMALSHTMGRQLRAGEAAMSSLHLQSWPVLTLVLEGDSGTDIRLTVTPDTYWQVNAPEAAYASAVLFGDDGQLGGQSILGLPLMNNYFTIFDRSVDRGLGAVKFAALKRPAGV